MAIWITVGDHEIAPFGKRRMRFSCSRWGDYSFSVDDEDQERLRIQFSDAKKDWPIFVKEVCGGVFRLSGIGGHHGPDAWWFELELGPIARVVYYGDRVLDWMDTEIVTIPSTAS